MKTVTKTTQNLSTKTVENVGVSHADDNTFVTSSNSRTFNQNKIVDKLDRIKKFLNDNKLFVNYSKTTLIEIMMKQSDR